jgi:hypothetical protein
MSGRYFEAENLADAASVDFDHNYKADIEELTIVLYTFDGSGNLTRIDGLSTPAITDFTIIETPGNENTQTRVTNNSGLEQDIAAVINHTGGAASASAGTPLWTKYTVAEAAFTDADGEEDVELFVLPSGAVIEGVVVKHNTAFTGGGLTAFTISVGVAGELDKYSSDFDVFQAVSATAFQSSQVQEIGSFGGTTSIRANAKSTTANVADATAGSVDIWVKTTTLP